MAEITESTAEINTSNYKMPEDSSDLFANLSIFSKNIVLKDTKVFESEETDISKWFGDQLIKYYNGQMNETDVINVMRFVSDYNNNVSNILGYIDKDDERVTNRLVEEGFNDNSIDISNSRLKVFGLYKTQNLEDSIMYNIACNIIFNNIIKNTEIKDKKSRYIESSSIDNENSDVLKILSRVVTIYCSNGVSNTNFKYIENRDTDYDSNIKNACECILLKEFFEIANMDITGEFKKLWPGAKYNASELEKSLVNNGSSICAFDFVYKETSDSNYTRSIIVYKELNPLYRDILKQDLVEMAFEIMTHTEYSIDKTIGTEKSQLLHKKPSTGSISSFSMSRISSDNDTSLTTYFLNIPRSVNVLDGDNIFATIQFSSQTTEDVEILSTNKLICYQYGNPYTARSSSESEVILYYYGDNFISNSYGKYTFQQKEIQQFLYNYQTCRDAYYHTYKNDAFVIDDKYRVYEKFFLICWAIQDTIDSKVDNTSDIDSYDYNDVVNFLKSYGMYDVADTINLDNFEWSEKIAKELLKRCTELVSKKGSRDIYKVLSNIFSVNNKLLKFYGIYLSKSINDDDKKAYYFLKQIDDDSDNIYEQIENAPSTSLSDFNKSVSDNLWKIDSSELDGKDITIVPTKYLKVIYDHELSTEFVMLRVFIAILDYIKNIPDISNKKISDTSTSQLTYESAAKNIKNVLATYILQSITSANLYSSQNTYTLYGYKLGYKDPDNDEIKEWNNDSINEKITSWYTTLDNLKNKTNDSLYYNDSKRSDYYTKTKEILNTFFSSDPNTKKYNMLPAANEDNSDINKKINNLLSLPYFLFSSSSEYMKYPVEYRDLLLEIFNTVFVPSTESISPTIDINESQTNTLQRIVELIENIKNDFNREYVNYIGVSIGVKNDENMDMLLRTLEYFISYTTKMLPFGFEMKINNSQDAVTISDSVQISVSTELVEQVYYDEELTLTIGKQGS